MNALGVLLWVILPYVCLTLLVAGVIWRWRVDKFGWTTRSSEVHERPLLRLGSPMFHFGLLAVAGGHFMGLLIPKTWTEAVGIPQHIYHFTAMFGGGLAGLVTTIGLVLLLYRRFTVGGVFQATTTNDKVMYVLLSLPIVLGMIAVILNQFLGGAHGYDYRETISPWLRGLLTLQPDPGLMADVPLSFQLHVLAGFLLFAILPFTRLVHSLTPPVGYPTRPYVVYRSRQANAAIRQPKRGWEPLPTKVYSDASSRSADADRAAASQ